MESRSVDCSPYSFLQPRVVKCLDPCVLFAAIFGDLCSKMTYNGFYTMFSLTNHPKLSGSRSGTIVAVQRWFLTNFNPKCFSLDISGCSSISFDFCGKLDDTSCGWTVFVTLQQCCPDHVHQIPTMDGAYHKNGIRSLVAALVLAVLVNLVTGTCTSTTCPPGPVLASFEYQNCTGIVSYRPIDETENYWFVCRNLSNTRLGSQLATYNENFVEITTYYGADDCPSILDWEHTSGRRAYTGVCRKLGSRSEMLLANVNQSYVSPQQPDESPNDIPNYQDGEVECSNQNSCSAVSGYFMRFFESETCTSERSHYVVKPNVTLSTCYSDDDKYTSLRCFGQHGFEQVMYVDPNCTRPYTSDFYIFKCGVGGSVATVYCEVDPPSAPVSMPVPSTAGGSPILSPVYSPTTRTSDATQLQFSTAIAITLLISSML